MSDKDENAIQAGTLLYFLFVGVSTVLGVLLPARGDSYPHAMTLVADLVAAVVPSIRGFVAVSSFPIATKMFLTAQWLSVPVLAVLISRYPSLIKPNQRTINTFSPLKLFGLLLGSVLMFIVYPAIMNVQPADLVSASRHKQVLVHVSESRLWMGVIGSSVIFIVSYMVALVISYVRVLLFAPQSQGE